MMNQMGLGVVVSMKDMFTRNAHRIQSSMMSLDATVAASSTSMQRNMQLVQRSMMTMGAGLALLAVPAIVIASTVIFRALARQYIVDAIHRWEKRVVIESVEFSEDPSVTDRNVALIKLSYRIIRTQVRGNLVYPFTREI